MNNVAKPAWSLAEAIRVGLPLYLHKFGSLPHHCFKVLNAIMACRSEAAGAHRDRCCQCGHTQIAYNSCRNRHCPRCQGYKAKQWSQARTSELLPLPYFHLVFTLPHELNPLALHNREIFYNLLFQAVSQTLLQLGADTRWLGGHVGFFAVLHTWTQTLMDHPHVHIVIPGGALSNDGKSFKRTRPDFIFPVKVMSALFRGKLLAALKDAINRNEILLTGSVSELARPKQRQAFFDTLYESNFVVYAKRPFAGPAAVVQYLSRYTHRVAISDHRIVDVSHGSITFRWRDRADSNTEKIMCLDAAEFARRFIMHILPHAFVKIRYFGFMANSIRTKALQCCLELLAQRLTQKLEMVRQHFAKPFQRICPACKKGIMMFDSVVLPARTG